MAVHQIAPQANSGATNLSNALDCSKLESASLEYESEGDALLQARDGDDAENGRMNVSELAQEYAALFVRPTLDEIQEQRMGEILAAASEDECLDRKLAEVEWRCGSDMGLFDEAHCHSYENQKAFLREYLGTAFTDRFITSTSSNN